MLKTTQDVCGRQLQGDTTWQVGAQMSLSGRATGNC